MGLVRLRTGDMAKNAHRRQRARRSAAIPASADADGFLAEQVGRKRNLKILPVRGMIAKGHWLEGGQE